MVKKPVKADKKATNLAEPVSNGKKKFTQVEQNWWNWRQINKLWESVKQLQRENDELRASIQEGS